MTSHSSEAAYTKSALELYDSLVWDFNSPFHWRIYPEEVQGIYQDCFVEQHFSNRPTRHCEVAVGTGHFLCGIQAESKPCSLQQVTLLDLNPNTLIASEARLQGEHFYNDITIEKRVCNILEDVPANLCGSFDTVAANFLIHCLHGGNDVTRTAFLNMARMLEPSGVFFGTTILGRDLNDDAERAGPAAIETNKVYNELGIFGNEQDSYGDISRVLHEIFGDVEIWRIGYCAAWKARKPFGT
jgi:ubiquinone/menaquinone biosynthesis C-methylase UbiE